MLNICHYSQPDHFRRKLISLEQFSINMSVNRIIRKGNISSFVSRLWLLQPAAITLSFLKILFTATDGYSYRNAFTGFEFAAFSDCQVIVSKAVKTATIVAMMKTSAPNLM